MLHVVTLFDFAQESDEIEGEYSDRAHKKHEQALEDFLELDEITVGDLENFVRRLEPHVRLRDEFGMNVRVGPHVPPPGGPEIREELKNLLATATFTMTPYEAHVAYETLHPFMDCNGRSGRALWLWMMNAHGDWYTGGILPRGFLHQFYYQALQATRE